MKQNSKNEKIRIGNNSIVSEIKSKPADEVTELAESIINTVREPLLILDKDLRVVKASRSFFDFFKVSFEETIGALIYDLGNRQWDIPKLKELLETILPEKTTFDNYEVEHNFAGIGNRVLLLNARQIERVLGKEKIILLAIEDITKRKHLEESLSETSRMTSEYLDILVNHAHFPIIIWDASFVITRFNNSFEKLSGYDISELMGKKIDFLFPENKRESTLKLLENSLGEEKFEIIEIDILRKDKEIRTVLWDSANVFDKEGKLIITTIAQDITKRKQTEDALKESGEIFNRFMENSPYYVFFKDKNIRALRLSANYERMLGKPLKSLLGKTTDELFPSELSKKMIEVDKEILNRRETVIVEEEFNGRYFTTIKFPIIINDEPRYLAGFTTDITERKQAEEALLNSEAKFRSYVNDSPQGIFVVNAKGQYIDANEAALNQIGCSKEYLLQKTIADILPKEELEKGLNHFNKLVKEGKSVGEFSLLKTNGEKIYVILDTVKISDDQFLGFSTDITERKRSEEALQKSEERYRSVTQSANDAIITTDSKGIIIDWNKGAQKIFGYLETEISGKKLDTIIPKDDLAEHIKNRERTEKDGEQSVVGKTVELQGLHKNGRVFPIELSLAEWEIPSGKFFTGIIRDITERKHNEAEILMLAHSLRSISECVSITDPEDKILFVNESFLKTYGYEEDELIGKQISIVRSQNNPPEFVEKILSATIREHWKGELLNIRKDGSEFPVYLSTTVINDKAGKPLRLIGIASDITAQKQMVDDLLKLSRAVEQSPASIVITDIKGNIEYANPKVTETTGYQFSELQGKNPRIFGTREKSTYEYKVLWDTISSGKEWFGEFHNKKKNGELFWESASISAIKNNRGEVIHYLAVKEDITEKKKMNDELISSKEKAEEMNQLKSNFLANMSHELRTPLVGILGYSDIIRQEPVSPEIRVMAETIFKSGNRLMETLNLILDLSRLETEKKDIRFQNVELVNKTKEIITLFRETAYKKGLSLISTFSSESIIINFDERAYYSILNNLINNAIKFTSEGSVTISLSLYNNTVELKVTDTGIGIAKNNYQSIFDEFRQASEGHNRNFEGSGLGLSITKKFVEKYGGTITVDSEVGKGSTFIVLLPVNKIVEIAKKPTASEMHSSTKFPEPKLLKPLGLVVDDDPLIFQFMTKYLIDYVVLETTVSAEIAFKMLKKKKYDIIFMDINLMRGIDGKKAASMIRLMEGYESTPIIAATAYAMAGDKEEFISAGCSHYLPKPFNKKEVIEVVIEAFKQ